MIFKLLLVSLVIIITWKERFCWGI